MSKRLTRKGVFAMCCCEFEEIIAKHLSAYAIHDIGAYPTTAECRFVFRCLWIPYIIFVDLEKVFSKVLPQYQEIDSVARVLAHSRMIREMCAWNQDPRLGWWDADHAEEGAQWWIARFDAYRSAVIDSYNHWMRRKCPDCNDDSQELAAAARYGFIQRIDVKGLPSSCVGKVLEEMKARERPGSRESQFFYRNALGNNPEPRWEYPDLDLWLFEVWPLVTHYEMLYKDVYDWAGKKFGESDRISSEARVLDSARNLKDRCKLLDLQISANARKTRGRPRLAPMDSPTRPTEIALEEFAVDIEPFTRLISGETSERFAVMYMPSKGGKQTSS